MGSHIFDLLRDYLSAYGYWALAGVLLLENAGVPLPGETILLIAGFMAYHGRLDLALVMIVATLASTVGDNLGYMIGFRGGRPLLERYRHRLHIPQRAITEGERLFARYGAPTVLVARFLFGLRIVAGPLAGVLRMDWRRFLLFNSLGAVLWSVVIASLGYLFGSQWQRLLAIVHEANFFLLVAVAVLAGVFYWRHRASNRS